MKRLSLPLMVLGAILALSGTAVAQYSSSNYKTNEVFFGSGGDTGQSSANYKAQASVGSLGVGQYSSANYQAFSGFLTPNEPFLELQIDTASPVSLGTLDTASTKTGISQFHVRAYVDSGYTVQTTSQPPSYTSGSQTHTLCAMSHAGCVSTTSTVGTEQFGINLRGNNSPAVFGSDPINQPSNTYAFGQAASGYNTVNQYKYNVGDTIACSGTGGTCGNASGWGRTDYTISYVANIALLTPAGSYSMTQDLVVVATY